MRAAQGWWRELDPTLRLAVVAIEAAWCAQVAVLVALVT